MALASLGLTFKPNSTNDMECIDGTVWEPKSGFGYAIETLQVIFVIMAALQMENVFFSIPKKLGYFDRESEILNVTPIMEPNEN